MGCLLAGFLPDGEIETASQPVILARMSKGRDGFRWGRVILVVLALLVINVPYGLYEWQQHRLRTGGTEVTATVLEVSAHGDQADIAFRFPQNVDSKQTARTVRVEPDVAREAERTHQLDVRILDGDPDVFYVDGQVHSWAGLVLTLVADALVLLMILLSWRLGGRIRRPTLVGIAVEDVQDGEDGSILDKQPDGTYVINGEVASTGPSSLVLTLRDRDVEIHLRDHENPVAVGARARVRAQLVG
jgi:hypothetical protein